jgi:hypothetical protein
VRKRADLLGVRASRIEIAHADREHRVSIGPGVAAARASRAFETDDRVSCIVPGHETAGTELLADELSAHDGAFEWELAGNCAFTAPFEYRSQ